MPYKKVAKNKMDDSPILFPIESIDTMILNFLNIFLKISKFSNEKHPNKLKLIVRRTQINSNNDQTDKINNKASLKITHKNIPNFLNPLTIKIPNNHKIHHKLDSEHNKSHQLKIQQNCLTQLLIENKSNTNN